MYERWSQESASRTPTLSHRVGSDCLAATRRAWEEEMEMRIVVPDPASATARAEQMSTVFGAGQVSLGGDREQVEVAVERGSDRAIALVVDAVERWLDHARVASAELWLGDRSYRVTRWVPIETWP